MKHRGFGGGRSASANGRTWLKAALGAVALTASAAGLSQAPPAPQPPLVERAKPALWVVRDADTTIYLFGTFHTLDPRTVWFDGAVRRSFDKADELVLETIVPSDPEEIRAAGRRQADADGKPKAFVAQTGKVVGQGKAMGLRVDFGADAILRRSAEAVGMPVSGLERFEDQLATLSNIPSAAPASAVAAPQPAVANVTLKDLLAAWTKGDTRAFGDMLANFEAKSPVAYRMLIADRNARWGQWIADRLDRPGTVFVAVGSGHLSGKDSVQAWLAGHGVASHRID